MTEQRDEEMAPIWPWLTNRVVETATVLVTLALGVMVFSDAVQLGPGWGESGPQPGFFPLVLSILLLLGAVSVVYVNIYRHPDPRPFFEVSREVVDLLKVGLPIAATVLLIGWAGIYITAGLYMAFFMAWYGKFRWYTAIGGGAIFVAALWLTLWVGFNISMPMSVFYKTNILPF